MKNPSDITSLSDIRLMVDQFYEKVKTDPLLSPIFNTVIQNKWPEHLEKMYRFWQTLLLEEQTYFGGPFPPHAKLPVNQAHFDRWLELWTSVIDEHFSGAKAEETKWRAGKMATMFLSKIEYYKNNSATPLM